MRNWFQAIYEIVFGQADGPRMGPFAKILGAEKTAALIKSALQR